MRALYSLKANVLKIGWLKKKKEKKRESLKVFNF